MKPLTNDQREEIKEIFDWGHFMAFVIKHHRDSGLHLLSEEDILLLIDAEGNLDMFSDYHFESAPCELCGSHGSVSAKIGEKIFILKDW